MNTINSFKGYGKVNVAEDRAFKLKSRRRLILIAVAAILVLVIIIGTITGVVISRRRSTSNSSSTSPSTISNSIKAVCSVTQYPGSCFSSLSAAAANSSVIAADPEQLFNLSLHIASAALTKASDLTSKIKIPSNDKRLQLAVRDCKELFDDAVDRLQDSIATMSPKTPDEKLLTSSKIDDLRTWLSAAITNQETCLDGFEGTIGGVRAKFEVAMTNSTQFASNSLAIATGILGILKELNFQIHRKLLSSSSSSQSQFPDWVLKAQRRVLLQDKSLLVPNVTVASDGTGTVKTIGEAVAMIPKKSLDRFVIYVKKGEYEENVVMDKNKWNVLMYGDGMYDTTVKGSLNFIDGTPTFATATVAVAGKGFMCRDMGFKNTAGPEKHQAVAFRSGSDRSIFYNCYFEAYQDTLYAHSMRQFYRECHIVGTVDFIFGDSAVIFQKCKIQPRQPLPNQQNIITAQGKKDPNEKTGIVLQGCAISPMDTVTAPTYLGRPWKAFSTTIVMQSDIGAVVDPTGWLSWAPGTDPPETINYAEFQNTGPGSDVANRVKWVGYKPAVSADEAGQYTVHTFLDGAEWIPQTGVMYQSTL